MNMRSKSLAAVTAAAIAFTGFSVPELRGLAGFQARDREPADTASVPTTDFSSRRRYYRNNNNAAAVGAMLAIAGTAAAIAASRRHRDRPLRVRPGTVLWRLWLWAAAGLLLRLRPALWYGW